MGKCRAIAAATGQQCRMKALQGGQFCLSHAQKPANIVEALLSRQYFARSFRDVSTFESWSTFFRAVYNLPMDAGDIEFFEKCTQRRTVLPFYPTIVCEIGRQGGKTTAASIMAVWEAVGAGWENKVNPGEAFNVFVVSNTRSQARICFDKIRNLLRNFKGEIVSDRNDEIVLRNGCHISIRTSDDKSIRGWGQICLCIFDEAQWFEGDNVESISNAVVPSIIEGGRMLLISSRNGSHGYVQDLSRRCFGINEAPTLVWRAKTTDMNSTYSEAKIQRDIANDPSLEGEYDPWVAPKNVEFFPDEMLQNAIGAGPHPYEKGRSYTAVIDSSSGIRDQMTMAIVSPWDEVVRVDCLLAYDSPFDFLQACRTFAETLKDYHLTSALADRYAYGQLQSVMAKEGITIEKTKDSSNEYYFRLRGLLDEGCVKLANDKRLLEELRRLELYTTPSGKRLIRHQKNFFDDRACVVASAIYHLMKPSGRRPTPGPVVVRREHPIPEQEAVLHNREEIEDNEYIFQEWLRATESGVCLPIKAGREPELIEVKAKRKIGRHPSTQPR